MGSQIIQTLPASFCAATCSAIPAGQGQERRGAAESRAQKSHLDSSPQIVYSNANMKPHLLTAYTVYYYFYGTPEPAAGGGA